MQRILLCLVLVLASATVLAETGYRIVHPDGSVEYSDSYQQGAEAISLPKAQGYATPQAPATEPVTTGPSSVTFKKEAPQQAIAYTQVSISSPGNEQTLFFDTTGMPVAVQVTPALQAGHEVVISLDGKEVVRGQTTSYMLGNVSRGTHTLSAAVVDDTGKTLKQGDAVTFYMRQHTVQ